MFASLEHYSLWELSESCVTVRREPRTEPCGSPPTRASQQTQRHFHQCWRWDLSAESQSEDEKNLRGKTVRFSYIYLSYWVWRNANESSASVRIFVQPHTAFLFLNFLSLSLQYTLCLCLSFYFTLYMYFYLSVCLLGCRFVASSTHRLLLNLQPWHRLLSRRMMWISTLRHQPTTRSTVASRGPRSNWRSGTATVWRGWVTRSSQGHCSPNMWNLSC